MDRCVSVHSCAGGHLGCLRLGASEHEAAVNTHLPALAEPRAFFLSGTMAGSHSSCMFHFGNPPNYFATVVLPVCPPARAPRVPEAPHPHRRLARSVFFTGTILMAVCWGRESPWGLIYIFPMMMLPTTFHLLIRHPPISAEVSIQTFARFCCLFEF